MIFKLKTSSETMKIFGELGANIHLQPFALCKIAIALSLRNMEKLDDDAFKTNNEGLELNRQTITGEWDELYKGLIEMFEGRHLSDDEYFQKYLKAHLDRGARFIYTEFRYSSDFILALLSNNKSI